MWAREKSGSSDKPDQRVRPAPRLAFHGKRSTPSRSKPHGLTFLPLIAIVRFAARIALEHQPVASWKDKALSEANPRTALTALMALARSSGGDKSLQQPILAALNKIDFKALKGIDRVTLIRDYMLDLHPPG
jgi:hypothetical protein